MNNAAAIHAVNSALAHYRRRQAHTPTDHSAREIAQMSVLVEYLHEIRTPETTHQHAEPHNRETHAQATVPVAA